MQANYFFFDGSALTSQIRILQKQDASFRNRKLVADQLLRYFQEALPELGSNEYKRAIFYFAEGDEVPIQEWIVMPEFHKPGAVRDIYFRYCGHKLKRSAEFAEFVATSVPPKWHDRFSKSEKGVDIELCCDALKLASASRIDRLFLFTNDGDFLPLCRALKEFGANVSLIHLHDFVSPNLSLLRETDSYDVVPNQVLQGLFTAPAIVEELALTSEGDEAPIQHSTVEPKSVGKNPDAQEDEQLDDVPPPESVDKSA